MEPIVLASGSPRRQEYFRLLGLPFICMPPGREEPPDPQAEPRLAAEKLAIQKVESAVKALASEAQSPAPRWVCGADTLISLEGKMYGKPKDRDEAARTLRAFQGREHQAISAVALYSGRAGTIDCRSVTSGVSFAPLSEGEIEWYLDSGEWRDAAGSYKIQGLASCFIASIKGSYSSIVGLPLREFYVMLRDNDYPFGG